MLTYGNDQLKDLLFVPGYTENYISLQHVPLLGIWNTSKTTMKWAILK